MRDVTGEQYAQVDNADPFAQSGLALPVHRTPEWIIWLVQLIRLLVRVIWFLIRHPLLDAAAGSCCTWAKAGWPGAVVLANVTIVVPGDTATVAAGLVRPARHGAAALPLAVVVLPAALAGGDDDRRAGPGVPRPGHAPGARPGRRRPRVPTG